MNPPGRAGADSARVRFSSRPVRQAAAVAAAAVLLALFPPGLTAGEGRFFHGGDGRVRLAGEKTGEVFDGRYRDESGRYEPSALAKICRVFGAPCNSPDTAVSLRLIEYLDFLQDRLRPGAGIRIVSGYRSPVYNTRLRRDGALAARASLHQYGMAADLAIEGVPAETVWKTVRRIGFGGTGYYHGETVHIDTGPARFWDETSSGVGTGISEDNKLIGLVTDFDRYRPGDTVVLRFVRMTAFPVGVDPRFLLERVTDRKGSRKTAGAFTPPAADRGVACPAFFDIGQMASFEYLLPENLASGRYAVTARFCDRKWPAMPAKVSTPAFQVTDR